LQLHLAMNGSQRISRSRNSSTGASIEPGKGNNGVVAGRIDNGNQEICITNMMASQQVERAAELQDPEVRAELNRRVRECKRECSTGDRLGSILQVSARARQQATREQVKGQWCESSIGTARRRCDQARQSCRKLRGCADRVSAAHAREQWRLSP
jgi:hypothetical protein